MISLPEAALKRDSSKIQDYMRCERKHFFNHIIGWSPDTPSIHLVFGSAWHLGIEAIYEGSFSSDSLLLGCSAFMDEFRDTFSPEFDTSFGAKNPANGIRGLEQYVERYRAEDAGLEILYVEMAGSAMLEDWLLYFKMDIIARCPNRGIISIDHKTSGRFSTTWTNQWRQKFQLSLYTYILHCLYPDEPIYGLIVNGFFPHDPPKMKMDGTPYANTKDNEFIRVPARRSMAALNDWINQAIVYNKRLDQDMDTLASCSDKDECLGCFSKCTEACGDYGGCPYIDFCVAEPNPLRFAGPPEGFHLEYWDPTAELKKTKEIVNV